MENRPGEMYMCMLHRAWSICSSYSGLNKETDKLRVIFESNGYSNMFYERIVKQFLISKFEPCNKSNKVNVDVDKHYVLKVPYVGQASLLFKRRIVKLVKDAYDVKLCCVMQSCKVKSYFSLKCKANPFLAANVVYKYTCQNDSDLSYIGETKRHIGVRAGEHLDINERKTAVSRHIANCHHCLGKLSAGLLDYRNFEIIKFGLNKFNTQVLEALIIQRSTPSLNAQLFKSGTSFTLKVFS